MKKTVAFRKIISILTLSLMLMMSTTACGEKPASGNVSSQDNPTGSSDSADNSSQSTPDGSDSVGEPSKNIPDGSDPGVSIAPGAPNVPGVGDNSSLYTPNTPSAGNDFSPSYSLEDVFNGNLDGLGFDAFSSVTEFYNSDVRVILEDLLNQVFDELNKLVEADMFSSFSISVEEPNILIYNFQYGEILDTAAITANLESNLEMVISSAKNDIITYPSYGIPVKVIRLNYLNADGELIYTLDVTENLDLSGLPDSPGSGSLNDSGNLQEWLDSDEAAETLETINNLIASTGFTLAFAMEGNTLIYQYYLPAGLSFDDFTEEEKEATFDAMVDANADSIQTLFTMFEAERGLTLDAVRIVVCSAAGTELYRRDVTP